MSETAVRTNIHKSFNIHYDFATEFALDFIITLYRMTQGGYLLFCQIQNT